MVRGLLIALLSACTPEGPTEAPPVVNTAPVAAPVVRLPEGARIVTDISGSMQGFLFTGSTRLTQLHEELTGAVGSRVPGSLEYCLVSNGVVCDGKNDLGRYSKNLYTGSESRFDKALDLAADDGPSARRATIVVTDGVYGGGSAAQASLAGCASGATAACISERLSQLVDGGFGVWAVAVALPFNGKVYAERAMDNDQFARMKAGLGDHQQVSEFKASATDASFKYAGPRPLLVLIVSKDAALGAALSADVAARFARIGLADPSGAGIQQAELSPLASLEAQLRPVITAGRIDRIATPGFQLGKQGAVPGGYALIARCGGTDNGALRLDGQNIHADTALSAEAPAGVAPRLKAEEGWISLGLVCNPLPAGGTTDMKFTLRGNPQVAAYLPPWVSSWSSPDTWSHPDRLFGLDQLATAAVRGALGRLPLDSTLHVRIERP